MYRVNIVEMGTNEVVDSFECSTHKKALSVERGANINLNHDKYYTIIEVKK